MIDTVAANTVCDRFTALLATPSAIVRLSQAMGYVWARNDCEGAQFIDPVTFAVAYVDAPVHSTLRDAYTLAVVGTHLANIANAPETIAETDMWEDVEVCTDCLMWQVNADDSAFCECADDTHSDSVHCDRVHDTAIREFIAYGDDEFFSTDPCYICEDWHSGTRHYAKVLYVWQ